MTDWQPIETAPRDGSWLLLWCEFGDTGREARIARWVADDRPTTFGRPFGPFVWATQDSEPNIGTIAAKIPTHWQPLPEPPQPTPTPKGERE